ncbi:MAG: cytochrome c3 family protein [Anaerolineales bacterium]
MRKKLAVGVSLAALGLVAIVLAACSSATPTAVIQEIPVTVIVPVKVTEIVEVQVPMTVTEAGPKAPNYEAWAASPHAKADAEAFVHWNTADPAEVPAACARCHSTDGYVEFVATGAVAKNVPIGSVITCQACHSPAAQTLTTVSFPSGATLTNLGPEARCMECHQGRASGVQVDDSITKAGATGDDAITDKLGFTNIHYFAAAVSRFGAQVAGGYQYPGQKYDVLFEHVPGMQSCVDCHDPHSTQVKVDKCQACHTNVTKVEDLKNIRMQSSQVSYDGSGDLTKGIAAEIEGMQAKLITGMQAYATQISGKGIVYDPLTYPYFFVDANGNGSFDKDEGTAENAFKSWTPRLVKAAYNYQTSIKDPGAFAHGGKYIIELLYDSLADLNTQLSTPIDMSAMHRTDAGHFAGSEEAFRHWDTEGVVPGTCAKCHSRNGVEVFLAEGVNVSSTPSNGFLCQNCHNDLSTFTRYTVDTVKFPSGAVLSFGKAVDANLCIECHQGRESTVSVDKLVAGLKPNEQSDTLKFLNVHYFAAGATLFGGEAKGAYQFTGQTYLGQNKHGDLGPTQCTGCHTTHSLTVQVDKCTQCHQNVKTIDDLKDIRMSGSPDDYNGNGDVTEGIAAEISGLHGALYLAMQAYATKTVQTGIVYDPNAYPYFFIDTNGDGKTDASEVDAKNGFNAWTPTLLEAAYNYQYVQKDPGTFAHNGKYILQVLYDSIKAAGGDVKAYTRP